MKTIDNPKSSTLSVWAGEDGPLWQRSTQVPVVHSVSFGYDDRINEIFQICNIK
jgi:cystathionine gamma-synthase